jgi:hypothetical protein
MERNTKTVLSSIQGTIDDMSPEELQKIVTLLTTAEGEMINVLSLHLKMLAKLKLIEMAECQFSNL